MFTTMEQTSADSWGYRGTPCVRYQRALSYPLQGQRATFEVGEVFTRGSLVKGDHLHVLPYSWTKESHQVVPGLREWHSNGYNGACTGSGKHTEMYRSTTEGWYANYRYPSDASNSVKNNVDAAALLKAQANLREAYFSLPMLLAERKASVQTIGRYSRFILNNVVTMQRKDLKKWFAAIKRYKGNKEKLKAVAQEIANRHLEFVFGLMPLLDDIEGLVKYVSKDVEKELWGRGRQTAVVESTSVASYQFANCEFERKLRYSTRVFLRYSVDLKMSADLRAVGFNPLYTWYDMTPLSFVVGWFSNLNLWVKSLDPLIGVTYITGGKTSRSERSCNTKVYKDNTARYVCTLDQKGLGLHSITTQTRTPFSREPGIQMPQLVDNTGFFAAAATVSLLIQRNVRTAEQEIGRKPFRYKGRKPRYLPSLKYRR